MNRTLSRIRVYGLCKISEPVWLFVVLRDFIAIVIWFAFIDLN